MQSVNKIACANQAGFNMKFQVKWNGGNSGWTGDYPIDQTKSVDLTDLNISSGSEVWPEVKAIAGGSKSGDHVVYDPDSNDTATYTVTGTTGDIKIKLQ
jgi:hypothetical protein